MATRGRFEFLVIGHLSSRSGLGHCARSVIRGLQQQAYSVSAVDVSPGGGETDLDSICVSEERLPRNAITISVLGVDEVVQHLLERASLLQGQALNVGFFWWELTHIPVAWAAALRVFDAQLAGSRFLHEILQGSVDPIPVIWAPHPLLVPADVRPSREQFGIPQGTTAFLTAFDPASEPTRKNPLGAVDAFQLGAVGHSDAMLIVRANTSIGGRGTPIVKAVAARAQQDPRVRLIENSLPYVDVLRLMASCDALISLHRAEGLGLPLLEAMALGKPVIATNWSGNLDFMSADNSCLVDYSLVKVEAQRWTYRLPGVRRHGRWAEPSIKDAARSVRYLLEHPEARPSLGARAAADARRYLDSAEQAPFAAELVELAHAKGGRTNFEGAFDAERMQQLRRLEYWQRLEPFALARARLGDLFDRHIGWRLHKPRAGTEP